MLGHVGFAVSDAEVPRKFHEAAPAPLGTTFVLDPDGQNIAAVHGRHD